jgi:hypothetical protein
MKEDFYENLKARLEENTSWPQVYLFKFIIPSDNQKLAQVQNLFGSEAQVSTRQSKSNKFISISAKEVMVSSDAIIETYKKAGKIEGIISL